MTRKAKMTEQTQTVNRVKTKLKPPPHYSVTFYNDDVTPMGFVVVALEQVFGYSSNDAMAKTIDIHNGSKAIVGTFLKAIAETKRDVVIENARKAGYPLVVTAEPVAGE